MKRLIFCLLMLCPLATVALDEYDSCRHWASFIRPICQNINQIMQEGKTDLYISGYAWHNRFTYRPEKIKTYNERAWGGGLGKGVFDEKGNWQGLYAFAFLDSHKNVEPVAGYAYLKVAHLTPDFKAGLGYSILVTARADIFNGIPFPGILPWASVFYKHAAVAATYIPGSAGAGNVLYLIAKYTF